MGKKFASHSGYPGMKGCQSGVCPGFIVCFYVYHSQQTGEIVWHFPSHFNLDDDFLGDEHFPKELQYASGGSKHALSPTLIMQRDRGKEEELQPGQFTDWRKETGMDCLLYAEHLGDRYPKLCIWDGTAPWYTTRLARNHRTVGGYRCR